MSDNLVTPTSLADRSIAAAFLPDHLLSKLVDTQLLRATARTAELIATGRPVQEWSFIGLRVPVSEEFSEVTHFQSFPIASGVGAIDILNPTLPDHCLGVMIVIAGTPLTHQTATEVTLGSIVALVTADGAFETFLQQDANGTKSTSSSEADYHVRDIPLIDLLRRVLGLTVPPHPRKLVLEATHKVFLSNLLDASKNKAVDPTALLGQDPLAASLAVSEIAMSGQTPTPDLLKERFEVFLERMSWDDDYLPSNLMESIEPAQMEILVMHVLSNFYNPPVLHWMGPDLAFNLLKQSVPSWKSIIEKAAAVDSALVPIVSAVEKRYASE